MPHFEGAIAGCAGQEVCWQTEVNWRRARQTLVEDLQEQGYTLRDVTTEYLTDTDYANIFAVERNSEVAYYLHFVSNLTGGRYITTEEPLTPEELDRYRN